MTLISSINLFHIGSFTTAPDYIGFKPCEKERGVDFLQKFQNGREKLENNLFLLSPVFLGCGIALYFALSSEPNLFVTGFLAGLFLILLCVSYFYRYTVENLYLFAYIVALVLCGVFLATYRTASLNTVQLHQDIKSASVTGKVLSYEEMECKKGRKVILEIESIAGLSPENTPRKVSLSIRKADHLHVGDKLKLKAGLHTPSPPHLPDGYSFRRKNYFEGIGAVGFSYGEPEVVSEGKQSSLEEKRSDFGKRVKSQLAFERGAVAVALLTGQRRAISEESWDDLRQSGLAHMLAISGLHVGLFAGTVFFFLRLLMACFPSLALNYPIKKVAAVFAIMAAGFYTIFVGANITAMRALIMAGLVFTAIIFDRSPISLRLVSVAALILLIFRPESLVSISFQMSFAAVTGLVVFYENLRPQISRWYSHASTFRKFLLYVGGVCATTIVATIATAPFSLYHFQTLPLYGLPANILAVPVLSFIVMPAAVLTYLLSLIHLDFISLAIMGWGIEFILWVAAQVADLPHSVLHVPVMGKISLLLMILAGILLFTLRAREKGLALIPIIFVVFLAMLNSPPDILLSANGKLLAVKQDKALYMSTVRAEKFTRELWTQALNIREEKIKPFPHHACKKSLCCDSDACSINQKIIYLDNRYPAQEYCQDEDKILISAGFSLRDFYQCRAKVIDRYTLKKSGAMAFYTQDQHYKIMSVADSEGRRPWSINIDE